jgi:MurNAc alpha-1-phosphate uridylyltransferase
MPFPVKAMILAAGQGLRMRPLTDHCPKPLLRVGDHALIEYHLFRLQALGVRDVVINVSYLAEQLIACLGGGERYGLRIEYSIEDQGPLGIMGGLRQALPLLGSEPFLLFSADVWFAGELPAALLDCDDSSHVVLTAQSTLGQFFALQQGRLATTGDLMDYAGIARLHPQHIREYPGDTLIDFIQQLIQLRQVTGSELTGPWFNVGTPDQLQAVQDCLVKKPH